MERSRSKNRKRPFSFRLAAVQLGGLAAFAVLLDAKCSPETQAAKQPNTELVTYSPEQAMNEIASRMAQDLTPYNVVNADEADAYMQQTGKTSEHFGEQISKEDSMRYYYMAGFRGDDLMRITAISWRESGRYPGAFGDNNFKDEASKSVGSSQIRCIASGDKLPCVGIRDWRTNFDPLVSAQHTYEMVYNESVQNYGFGSTDSNSMGYDGRFHPWNWGEEHVKKYGPDPAFYKYLPEVQNVYAELSEMYGDLSA